MTVEEGATMGGAGSAVASSAAVARTLPVSAPLPGAALVRAIARILGRRR